MTPSTPLAAARRLLLISVVAGLPLSAPGQARNVTWRGGAGEWLDAARWDGGVPDGLARAVITGHSDVQHARGSAVTGGLLVGAGRGDHARLVIDGSSLVVRRTFTQIGEEDNGVAEVVLNRGAFHNVSAIYVGGANSVPGRKCRGTLCIRGGSFVTRIITLGWGAGSQATLAIEGSHAEAVHALDYVTAGAYLKGEPSTNTFSFTLDERGVTPITIQHPQGGLSLRRREAANVHRLRIQLAAVPPREDVTLLSASVPTQGEFEALPEGAEISAAWQGREFKWNLTYRGGARGCDLVLRNVQGHRPGEGLAKSHARRAVPEPLWTKIPLRESLPAVFEPAFEGAEGFGAIARGGRGGREIAVENCADRGPGSLRAAVATKGPRNIVFRVGGTITLESPLVVREPYVSILGQTAPGDGITLRGQGLIVQTHDVVLRHLRVRPGEESAGQDALEFYDAQRCIADHCSFQWGDDETCSVVGLSDAITIQHCIIAEGLNHAGHSMASIAGGERTTWHDNLFAHCRTRNPRFAGVAWCDFRYNVIYNWGDTAAYGDFERVNLVGNWFQPGPSTTQKPLRFFEGSAVLMPGTLFAAGNVLEGLPKEVANDNWAAIQCAPAARARAPFPAPTIRAQAAGAALRSVLDQAGATLPKRDAVDARIVRDARSGTGRIINRASDLAKP